MSLNDFMSTNHCSLVG